MQGETKISGIIEAARTTPENASLKPLDPNADLREAAEQFEAIFLNEFMKQARKAKLAEDILNEYIAHYIALLIQLYYRFQKRKPNSFYLMFLYLK